MDLKSADLSKAERKRIDEEGWMNAVTNYEVLQTLLEELKSRPAPRAAPPHVLKMNAQFLRYLTAHCAPTCKQTKKGIKKLIEELEKFPLTKAERLQIVNLLPRTLVEIHLLIEECEERFTDDDLLSILRAVKVARPRIGDEEDEPLPEPAAAAAAPGEEEEEAPVPVPVPVPVPAPAHAPAPTPVADMKKPPVAGKPPAGAKAAAPKRRVLLDDDNDDAPQAGAAMEAEEGPADFVAEGRAADEDDGLGDDGGDDGGD
ncbi:putative RNA polymerase Rpb4 [Paratrimastix pyriformis]|uniref:DNA-directed RNA polymerase III subunit RPC9 n=1 Tax=Paratrimastix pyriformis TaxID=342808 RepID=A0ABQ8UXP9_9EUKA|nr:putative RNA polymerase Rpb4 [Paratrimastix pyriformis]